MARETRHVYTENLSWSRRDKGIRVRIQVSDGPLGSALDVRCSGRDLKMSNAYAAPLRTRTLRLSAPSGRFAVGLLYNVIRGGGMFHGTSSSMKGRMSWLASLLACGFLVLVFLLIGSRSASALPIPAGKVYGIPAFARKYGMPCSACHEAWPKLNNFGQAFQDT